ncbi:MAG: RNA 2',3'-cyclic phosphodiesterase [Clostridia bacterium]|nr:RNA 2',3'-cyclic phosphodiesterase [Clostridia bacterium]
MRLFISINLDEETKKKILEVQDRLKSFGRGNFTKEDNLHLTLSFLGEVDVNDLPKVKRAMERVSFPKLHLRFGKTGCFRRDSELWWIGIDDNRALNTLQKKLTEELVKEGLKPDRKRFVPHITLSREMHTGLKEGLSFKPFTYEASSISLMLSSRENGRLTYTSLYEKKGAIND